MNSKFLKIVLLITLVTATAFPTEPRSLSADEETKLEGSTAGPTAGPNPSPVFSKSKVFEQLLENYDRRVRPFHGGPAVQVKVSIYILNILSVSEVDMEFSSDLYFRQQWTDPRLEYRDTDNTIKYIRLDYESAKSIWHPDTFFPNEKAAYVHLATMNNEFIRLLPNGNILKSTRFTLTITCPMNLKYFPMDTQICRIILQSYGYANEELVYSWSDSVGVPSFGLSRNEGVLPQFRVVGSKANRTTFFINNGNFSNLGVDIQLARSMGYYLMQVYTPCLMLVIVSWFSLWMDRESITERMSLGVTTILTITMLVSSANGASPKIPYVKAIDVYLGACFFFVFASLLENSAVGFFVKRSRKNNEEQVLKLLNEYERRPVPVERMMSIRNGKNSHGGQQRASLEPFFRKIRRISESHFNLDWKSIMMVKNWGRDLKRNGCHGWLISHEGETAETIDSFARICFPGAFLAFNCIYWIYYIKASEPVTVG